ncbi:hypothetical protein [Paraburkholderia sp. RL17-347-BIC-D]|uniref:hypothetical protein n=1 Tax=Paraburkholderia sp. RL17-347-BIC-D TaxID=3031632 RepID=UPI0038BD0DE0
MNQDDVIDEFRKALDTWKSWLDGPSNNWRSLSLGPNVRREDILKLDVELGAADTPDKFFDHRQEERRLVLFPPLLNAYASFWSRSGTSARTRQFAVELFLLHEWRHISQGVASSTYMIDGPSQTDFFATLDYAADAYAIDRCFRRYVATSRLSESKLLVELLEAHLSSGFVFGAVESTYQRAGEVAIDGARIRRQLIWAIQTARARCFPPEAGFAAFNLNQPLNVKVCRIAQDLMPDLCDAGRQVTAADFDFPSLLIIQIAAKRDVRHPILYSGELSRLRDLLFKQDLSASVDAFRSLFADHPELVGRGVGQTDVGKRRSSGRIRAIDAVIETYRWEAGNAPAAALLRADYEVVPFHMRRKEITEFCQWSETSDKFRIRIIVGDGGVGKTRFSRQFGRILLATGQWSGGFVNWTPDSDRPPSLRTIGQSTIAIIDYAEQSPETLNAVLQVLHREKGKARLILLARTAGSWLDKARRQRGTTGDLLQSRATEIIRLEGIGHSAKSRLSTASKAETEFRKRLGLLAIPLALEEPQDVSNTLLLHASVLSRLLGASMSGSGAVLHWLAEREQRFWCDHARLRELPAFLESALCEVAALICVTDGAVDCEAADVLVRCAPQLGGQPEAHINAIRNLFHELYPGPKYLNPVQPDLIKETVIAQFMTAGARKRLAAI